MHIAIRGEGPTDMGRLDGTTFQKGPMVILIEKMDCFKVMKEKCCGGVDEYIEWIYVHKNDIKQSKEARKKGVLRSKKQANMKEKRFFRDAEAFATIAKEKEAEMMIFFVDGDKGDKNEYERRYRSIVSGFTQAGVADRAIPMIPNKISEAWLLCCETCENCDKFEKLPTGDESNPRNPKNILRKKGKTVYQIAQECDPNCIDMPSFNRFREDFRRIVNNICGYNTC